MRGAGGAGLGERLSVAGAGRAVDNRMDRVKTIVVGLDFSPASVCAVRQALRIARWHGARVVVAHVADVAVGAAISDSLCPQWPSVAEAVVEDAQWAWRDLAKKIPGAAGLEMVVVVGSPTAEISRLVREEKADLVVLGVRGGRSAGPGAGTHASQLVRHAPAEVLLVQEGQEGRFTAVVACVDFSATSRRALLEAARVALHDGAGLHIVYAYRTPWSYSAPKAGEPERNSFHDEYAAATLRGLEEFCTQGGALAVEAQAEYHLVEEGSAARGIARLVKEVCADLVVVGTRGRTNMRDLLIGSTAERVVREAACSVLTVPPER